MLKFLCFFLVSGKYEENPGFSHRGKKVFNYQVKYRNCVAEMLIAKPGIGVKSQKGVVSISFII